MTMSEDRCPPHFFVAAWSSENTGVLFCRYCGEIRELKVPALEAPIEERVPESADLHPPQ